MCSPEDSSNNSPHVYGPHKRSLKMGNMTVVLGCLAVSVVLVTAIPVICFFVVRKKIGVGRRSKRAKTRVQMNPVPTRWLLAEMKSATMGFHRNTIVSEGASAVVYKEPVPSGGAVAVKLFDQYNEKHSLLILLPKFAIICLKHKNFVQLQRWCCEGSKLVLVYEYLPNGSLDRLFHRNSDSSTFLSWSLRLKVLLGVSCSYISTRRMSKTDNP